MKKTLSLILCLILTLVLIPAAFAYESPTDQSVVGPDGSVVTVAPLSTTQSKQMDTLTEDFIKTIENNKANNTLNMEYLLANMVSDEALVKDFMSRLPAQPHNVVVIEANISLANATYPCTISINAAEIREDDAVVVGHITADNKIEYIAPNSIKKGVVEITVNSTSPFRVYVFHQTDSAADTLPKTGDATPIVWVVLGLLACVSASVVVFKRLRA